MIYLLIQFVVVCLGRMYVTKKFLCFYSNLFGLEKKVIDDITDILPLVCS